MKIGVVILNYHNWQDTVLCAESVLTCTERPTWVVIVDNASPNDSVVQLMRWAEGNLDAYPLDQGAKSSLHKPFPLLPIDNDTLAPQPGNVCLLCNKVNRGYAAGNNAGIRPLMRWGADAIWILNNDTIVDKGALGAMRERLFSKARPGLCGSRVHYMKTGFVQCRGGGNNKSLDGAFMLERLLFSR